MDKITTVQADFDRIALLTDDGWDHNTHYHRLLLQHAPPGCTDVLEIGCGTGAFSRRLAGRATSVLAVDLSPQMIRIAKARSTTRANIDFQVADALSYQFPEAQFDCIASIATLHRLPFAEMLARMKSALKPGGTLLVLDLLQSESVMDICTSMLAMPASLALRLIYQRRLRPSREVRAAWDEHARHDVYLTLTEVRRVCATHLPGARVRKHLFWRYSIVWKKPAAINS
jgi:ubiquinone/menaquinone biosynthesis C-methylase UbiE